MKHANIIYGAIRDNLLDMPHKKQKKQKGHKFTEKEMKEYHVTKGSKWRYAMTGGRMK